MVAFMNRQNHLNKPFMQIGLRCFKMAICSCGILTYVTVNRDQVIDRKIQRNPFFKFKQVADLTILCLMLG